MNKNEINENQEMENLLKDKMNELSSSVDCFDRISARVFPDKNEDFSDSEFTVSDLETITGVRRKLPVIKWTAAIAAVAVCIAVIPKGIFMRNFMDNPLNGQQKIFNRIISEIREETAQNDYTVYDMTLEEYTKWDRLVTPLYPCPFEYNGKNELNVRIFIRTHNSYNTSQIYAVEYSGEYDEMNFIAAAESKAKFSENDLEYADELMENGWDTDREYIDKTIRYNFISSYAADGKITDNDGNNIYLASFDYPCIVKEGISALPNTAQFIFYCMETDESMGQYYYDIIGIDNNENPWKNAVGFDGVSTLPTESRSMFIWRDIFGIPKITPKAEAHFAYVTPDFSSDSDDVIPEFYNMTYYHYIPDTDGSLISSMPVPLDNSAKSSFTMYFSPMIMALSSGTPVIKVTSSADSKLTASYDYDYAKKFIFSEEQESTDIEYEQATSFTLEENEEKRIFEEIAEYLEKEKIAE